MNSKSQYAGPDFLTVTGIHKSGNSWLGTMVAQLHNELSQPPPSDLRPFFCLHDLMQSLPADRNDSPNISAQTWCRRLLNPTPKNRLVPNQLPPSSIAQLARRVRWNIARANQQQYLDDQQIQSLLHEQSCYAANENGQTDISHAIAAKHLPLRTALDRFDQFRVVWLIRDPRDALVSYFYHDMGVLVDWKLKWFEANTHRAASDAPAWRANFLSHRIQQQIDYYRLSLGFENERVLIVRYEDMLADTAGELTRIAKFANRSEATVQEIARRFSFRQLTQSNEEQKDSFVRKGVAGEWRSYFSQSDQCYFDNSYCDILIQLGYEPDESWLQNLSVQPSQKFELSRFRKRSSALYQAKEDWSDSASLQQDFPRPFDLSDDNNFYTYLQTCSRPRIRNWFKRVDELFTPTDKPDRRHNADQTLGY